MSDIDTIPAYDVKCQQQLGGYISMHRNLRDKRTWVKGILVDCPLGAPLETCPASTIRSLPLVELVNIVNGLTPDRLDAIIAHHEACMKQRETASA